MRNLSVHTLKYLIIDAVFAVQFVLCEGSEDEILAETIKKYQEEND